MCGLSCYFQFDHSENSPYLNEAKMAKSLELINHRGPDGSGTYFSSCGRCVLGHVRLSIIGLDDGLQPLSNHDQSIHAVVNGEVYGYKDIKVDLEAKGYVFKTATDSKVVLYLYEEYGISFLDHLRGEYAFQVAFPHTDLRSFTLVCNLHLGF